MFKRQVLIAAVVAAQIMADFAPARGQTQQPQMAPLKPKIERELPPGRGFIPPLRDLSHLDGASAQLTALPTALPTSFDWRTSGMITSVKNQSSCGSCYAFAGLGNLEALMLIDGAGTYDFSENYAKECNFYQSSCGGGTYEYVVNLFSQQGAVLEACNPYVAADVACNSSCPKIKTILDWCIISDDAVPTATDLKQYIYDHGPVYTTLYAGDGAAPSWETEYNNYDGSYTLYYTGTNTPNHAVLIVGWDDALTHAGGTGGWIVKNSWGTGWGGTCGYGTERGYFTIAYGSASIGKFSSYSTAWQDYDATGELLYYDEAGASANWGFTNPTAWGLCGFTTTITAYLNRVEFWTNDITTDVDVYVYDDFDGNSPSNLLGSKLNLSFTEAGYHSVVLDSPPLVPAGEDIFVVVKITNDSYGNPICADGDGYTENGLTYMSPTGTNGSWWEMGAGYGVDVAIRARTSGTMDVYDSEPDQLPTQFRLGKNYPNPFNPSTIIEYSLTSRATVKLDVYNVLGQKIKTLVDATMPAGNHSVVWNGTDDSGNPVASGMYLYQIQAGVQTETRKMLLLK
ncbi:MAG: C1 family peptidase [Candidatus Zixiibacteriota bacterium]